MAKLSDPVTMLKGVGEVRAKQLAQLNIFTLRDLICHFPRGYEDRTKLVPIEKLEPDVPACFRAMVMNTPRTSHIRKGLDLTKVQVADSTGRLNVTFFNSRFAAQQLEYGREYIFYGAVSGDFIGYSMTNPVFEAPESQPVTTRRILPIYPLTAGLTNAALLRLVQQALAVCGLPEEILPAEVREKYGILPRADEDVSHPHGLRLQGGHHRRRDPDRPAHRQGQRSEGGHEGAAGRGGRGHMQAHQGGRGAPCDGAAHHRGLRQI